MAYKPILAPEEFWAWLKARAERQDRSMAAIMRELPEQIDTAEQQGALPVAGNGKQHRAQQVPA